MMAKELEKEVRERMGKAVEALHKELSGVRMGKATPSLLDGITVECYDSTMPLSQVANLSAPEARLLVVQPWDKTLLPEIIKAIQKSDLGLNPQSDSNVIRIPIPPLTEERRRDTVKLVKRLAEEGRVAIRNIRRDANEELKRREKKGEIGEDDSRKDQEEVQKVTDEYIEKIEELIESKEKEVMEV
jgi:ribosome recycling factor